jgi:hypothetical protein
MRKFGCQVDEVELRNLCHNPYFRLARSISVTITVNTSSASSGIFVFNAFAAATGDDGKNRERLAVMLNSNP